MKKRTLANRLDTIKNAKAVICNVPERHEPVVEEGPVTKERGEVRRTGFKYATVYFAPDLHLDCVILDMHSHGARIKLHGAQGLPNSVMLAVPGLGFRAKAEVVWRQGEETGLKFTA